MDQFEAEDRKKGSLAVIEVLCQDQYQNNDQMVGLLEYVISGENKIIDFTSDPHQLQEDSQFVAINYVKQQKWMKMSECLKYQKLGQIKGNQCQLPDFHATYQKGYIIQITDSDHFSLKSKTVLRKELKSQSIQIFSQKEEAGKLSLNNQMCKLLLDKFNSLLGFPKIESKQIKIQRQFVFQVLGREEYYYCEMIEPGRVEKINGNKFQVKYSELHQYLNAFSLFTYHLMNRQLIISNLQVVGSYLHDMIVSTRYKIFSPIDQGLCEIVQMLEIFEKAPSSATSKFWNDKIQEQAKIGWK